MTNPASVVESQGPRIAPFLRLPQPEGDEFRREPEREEKRRYDDFGALETQFGRESRRDRNRHTPMEDREPISRETQLTQAIQSLTQAAVEPFVATHHEELYGYVKKIVEGKAYVIFETPGGPLERAVKLSKLEAIHADRQGALIRLVVEERGASMITKFENLEEKAITTWRDKIKDEDLQKFDLLEKSALPRKPSKLQ
jgi:hypothetical protein